MQIKETGFEDAYWIQLAEYGDQCRALLNMVIKLWVPLKVENFLT